MTIQQKAQRSLASGCAGAQRPRRLAQTRTIAAREISPPLHLTLEAQGKTRQGTAAIKPLGGNFG
jgi:hypothetical protein